MVITFGFDFIDDSMESDEKFEEGIRQIDPKAFMVNYQKVKSGLGHLKKVVEIFVKLGSKQIIIAWLSQHC